MNKIYTIMIALLMTMSLSAQRVILVEEVTSASCGPCASQNPAFDNLIGDNLDMVAIIKYQRGGDNPACDTTPGSQTIN